MSPWTNVKVKLLGMTTTELHKLIRLAGRELRERWQQRDADRVALREGMGQMANFAAGVTWALACRSALRESKDHPPLGKRPAHGAMWAPWEVLYCVRHQVRARGWHPIVCRNWTEFHDHFTAEMNRTRGPDNGVAVFNVQMAAPTYCSAVIHDRFDVGS